MLLVCSRHPVRLIAVLGREYFFIIVVWEVFNLEHVLLKILTKPISGIQNINYILITIQSGDLLWEIKKPTLLVPALVPTKKLKKFFRQITNRF